MREQFEIMRKRMKNGWEVVVWVGMGVCVCVCVCMCVCVGGDVKDR